MEISDILLIIIFLLSFLYFILGWIAYSGIENSKDTWSFGITFWWFKDTDKIYGDLGKSLLPYGKWLFWLIIILTVIWLLVRK